MSQKYKIILIENGHERELQEKETIKNLKIITNTVTKDNIIKIHMPAKFAPGCTIDFRGTGTMVELGSSTFSYNFEIITCLNGKNLKIIFDENISMLKNVCFFLNNDNAEIKIGKNCMFSKDISVWASEGHEIIDKATGKSLNQIMPKVIINEHVWIGTNVTINPGVIIGSDSIIGEGSCVTNSFPQGNCIIAGNPAKLLRTNITWKRNRPHGWEYHNFTSKDDKIINSLKSKKIIAIIPSRFQSSRFPGKPLALIHKKPMVQWVYERVSLVNEISEVYVATDDQRIFDAVNSFGGNAIMTNDCSCGSERVYQASQVIDADIVLNIQGDEPMIKPEMIRDLISAFNDPNVEMATLKKEITAEEDINNPNIAKLITDINENAIYFSRSKIPYNRDGMDNVKYYKHIGVYGYTKEFLKKFVSLPPSILEKAEQLEQLRAIENGYKIRVVETKFQSIGVDLPEHIAVVEAEMCKEKQDK